MTCDLVSRHELLLTAKFLRACSLEKEKPNAMPILGTFDCFLVFAKRSCLGALDVFF